MPHRSWLLVPAGNEKKLLKAATSGADVVVLDLVVPRDLKGIARTNAQEWLEAYRTQVVEGGRFERWVRIDALDTPYWREDVVAALAGGADGIILPQAAGPEAVQHVAAELYELEERNHMRPGSVRIVPQVADTARAASRIHGYAETVHPRLAGLAWSGATLMKALGGTRSRDAAGNWNDVCRQIRVQTLLAARAGGIMAIEAIEAGDEDVAPLAGAAHGDGFAGIIAGHPAQVAAINQAYGAPVPQSEPALPRPALAVF